MRFGNVTTHVAMVGNTTFRGVPVFFSHIFGRKHNFSRCSSHTLLCSENQVRSLCPRSAGLWRGVCGSATPGRMGDMKAVMISVEDLENLITDRYAECASHERL